MRQNKITKLSTRSLNDELIGEAIAKGISIDVIPFIQTQPIHSIEVQQEIEQALMRTAVVVFTSVNAVEAAAAEMKDHSPDWQIFCIGQATYQSIEKYFGTDLISGAADNARDLANMIIDNSDADEVIFFCGDQRRNELPDALRKNNIEVHEIIVYNTVATPNMIEKKYDGILFFSPSAVSSFFQNNQLDEQAILFAIGSTTASEIKKFSKNKIVVSDVPDKKSLLEKLISYFQSHPIHH
jgi:uroporphyrinogen-III synthase